ncbi:uncharacterized protein LOC120073551 [Benincasa hispida]|uniref:uncharacterized protein LOC120073551 n=1 Tax=Benincasa hispida TaxID=102211 RepID=UPI00190231ED|nr:uncharacterized protein LOC120073551 [Benincasa hispida]
MQGLSLEAKHLRDFRKYYPLSFDGALGNPTKAEMWLSSIEMIFHFMRCLEEHKLQCAVFMLTGNAKIWWRSVEKMIDTGGKLATWEQFKECFYEKYFSANTWYNKQAEFLNFKQGVMSVEEYEQDFDKLSHFAPKLVATETIRTNSFIQGLKSRLRGMVHALELKTYAAALWAAVRIDADSQLGEDYRRSLRIGTSAGQKRKAYQKTSESQQKKPVTIKEEKPICNSCRKHHWGRCLARVGVCYRYGQKGHMAYECPNRSTTNDRNQPSGQDQVGSSGLQQWNKNSATT